MELLTHAEEIVMMLIWKSDQPIGNADIIEQALDYGAEWKRQTVSTFLTHLREKGYVSMVKQGTRTFYEPLVDMRSYRKYVFDEMISLWYNGNVVAFVADAIAGGSEQPQITPHNLTAAKEYLISRITQIIRDSDIDGFQNIIRRIEDDHDDYNILKESPICVMHCKRCESLYGCPVAEPGVPCLPEEEILPESEDLCVYRFNKYYGK